MTTITYTDKGVAPGSDHSYDVEAVDSAGASSPSAVATVQIPPSGGGGAGTPGLWASDWRGAAGGRTAAQWSNLAAWMHLVVGSGGYTDAEIEALHAANPNLLVLAYNLGPYLGTGSAAYKQLLAAHPDYFAWADTKGTLITVNGFNNTLMDPTNPNYRAWAVQQAVAAIAGTQHDGLMFDSCGSAPIYTNYVTAPPVNHSTGAAYSKSQWLTAEVTLLNAIKAALPAGTVLLFNGLVSESLYSQWPNEPTSSDDGWLATSNADGGVAERWLRNPTDAFNTFPSAGDVTNALRVMADMQSKGMMFFAWTKTWDTSPTFTAAQIAQWEGIALAVHLLGQEAGSYMDFSTAHNADDTQNPATYPNLLTRLGAAQGPYSVSGTVFARAFAHGTVKLDVSTGVATIPVV